MKKNSGVANIHDLKLCSSFAEAVVVVVAQCKSTLVNRVFAYILIPNNGLPVINCAHWYRSGGGKN